MIRKMVMPLTVFAIVGLLIAVFMLSPLAPIQISSEVSAQKSTPVYSDTQVTKIIFTFDDDYTRTWSNALDNWGTLFVIQDNAKLTKLQIFVEVHDDHIDVVEPLTAVSYTAVYMTITKPSLATYHIGDSPDDEVTIDYPCFSSGWVGMIGDIHTIEYTVTDLSGIFTFNELGTYDIFVKYKIFT